MLQEEYDKLASIQKTEQEFAEGMMSQMAIDKDKKAKKRSKRDKADKETAYNDLGELANVG